MCVARFSIPLIPRTRRFRAVSPSLGAIASRAFTGSSRNNPCFCRKSSVEVRRPDTCPLKANPETNAGLALLAANQHLKITRAGASVCCFVPGWRIHGRVLPEPLPFGYVRRPWIASESSLHSDLSRPDASLNPCPPTTPAELRRNTKLAGSYSRNPLRLPGARLDLSQASATAGALFARL